ncbi:transcription factor NF-E2 45 kDa subunit isoform X1 [Hippocampus comes]|uniref:Nuclear factor, erythroid 2 n=1 Tax=Hippocampus comes TaxID=109280 RepID=A0A3Q2YCZ6_HIPCM|nr:PREDICTED: transcription factor NF-E2 45 kDa subunit-like isoform X1 [Hippocampus comes]
MCSTANYVLPPSRTCEVLACPSSRVCWGVPANHLGGRSHGAQHSDMDAAWQELMAITELQGLETCGESSYETKQYQSIEPAASLGMYEAAHCHPEPTPAAFDVGTMDEYDGGYSEEAAGCHRRGTNAASLYENSGPQLNQRMVSISSDAHQSTAVLTGQMSSPGASQGDSRPNSSLPRGAGPHMMWTVHGHSSFAHSADDLESDSGLSLGSSPPLASPGNLAAGVPGYRSADMSVACSDGEPEGMVEHRRAHNYQTEYQSHSDSYLQRGAQPSYFTTQHHLSHSHFDAPNPRATKHQTMGELHSSAFSSRGSWQNSMHSKSYGNPQAPASRDERRAIALKIPFTMEKIINLPVDDFNELLTQHTLTDAQLALIKDIRRRGKNKVAAQNCRKRKLDSIIHLERELGQLQVQRDDLVQQRLEFQRSLTYIKCHLTKLYAEVFSHLRDETGQPYSIDEYYLQQMADGQTYLVPHTMMHKKEC